MSFIGRDFELSELNELYKAKGAKLAVIYGRRRVGKSTLVDQFIDGHPALTFEGLEKEITATQIKQFSLDLAKQIDDPLISKIKFDSWNMLFDYLTDYLKKQNKKVVLFFDEFQWLAVNRSKLVSLLKKYWDQEWSKLNVLLILCGSVSTYMVKKVIRSKALYGRINWELCLEPLSLNEIHELLGKKRSLDEVMQYALILGGIPKYLNEINTKQSLEQNINRLCFIKDSYLSDEYSKIFYSQFKEYRTYETIVNHLKERPLTLDEIAKKIKMTSGGGVKDYLDNLEKALLISSYVPYTANEKSKLKKYKLTDEYLRFYFKYIAAHKKLISSNIKRNLFTELVKPAWQSWLGFAFENFCMKNALFLAEKIGFDNKVLNWGPVFSRGDKAFQIDLVYVRSDRAIVVCEIKYVDHLVKTSVIPDVEKKCQLITLPHGYTLEKVLITRHGAEPALIESDYFHHILKCEDLFHSLL